MSKNLTVTLSIPAYARPKEFEQLLSSIADAHALPDELMICEDCSPDRDVLRHIVEGYRAELEQRGCLVRFVENDINLGYDGNVRKAIEEASSDWVMLIGNDDVVLPNWLSVVRRYLLHNPGIKMVSRAFERFDRDPSQPVGISRLSGSDCVFSCTHTRSRMLFRAVAFFGGLVVNRDWATKLHSVTYDGTLYYQVYLAAHAFCQGGIGYMSTPTVGARAGNPPLFGAAEAEKKVFQVGRYSPKARAYMWSSVMRICDDVGKVEGVNLLSDIQKDLMSRMSFHVFEMMANAPSEMIDELCLELRKIGLYPHPVPFTLRWVIRLLGPRSRYFFQLVRKVMQ
jgi:glycosyltransferase involved in cell wall biosynthesis